jgi:[acyl-carrier-protein] S-malonyltransferase
MGEDIAASYPSARETFAQADDLLAFSLSKLCFHGPEDQLNNTFNTQPALYVTSMATLSALHSIKPDLTPHCAAGHSLGELTALTAAGVLSFEHGLRLVRERGRLMAEAGEARPGAMAALLGLDAAVVRSICEQASAETGAVVVLANDNCPGQVVISGEVTAIERALELAKEAGSRRAVQLAVSIASHSPLMAPAAQKFADLLAEVSFQAPAFPVYGNVTAAPLEGAEAVRHELAVQLTSSVRWTETVRAMIAAGARHFVEIGPKDVLTGLLKRIDASVTGVSVNNVDALRSAIDTL